IRIGTEATLVVQPAGISESFGGRHRGELGEAVHAPDFLRAVQLRGIEVGTDPAQASGRLPEQALPEGIPADATRGHHSNPGHRSSVTPAAFPAVRRGMDRQHQSFEYTRSNASPTVSTPSSSDSSTVMPNCSSSAITSSTRSRLSASRSLAKLAFRVTFFGG